MDFNTLYPSNYLKAADVPAPRIFTVKAITIEEIGDEKKRKPVLFFHEEARGLVLNKTNGGMLAHCYGPETDHWLGRQIELFSEAVSFQGRIVNAIRVRVPQQVAQPVAPPLQPAPAAQPVAPQAPVATAPVQPVAVQPLAPTAQPAAPAPQQPAAPMQQQAAPMQQQAAPVAQPVQQGFADLDEDATY